MKIPWWVVLPVAVSGVGLLTSLAFPVDGSSLFGPGTPSCGSPLLHGVDFSASGTTFDGSDLASWQDSTICGAARADRLVSNATLTCVLLVAVLTVVLVLRARRWLLNTREPMSKGGGVLAALANPLLGPLVGLIFARHVGTRRMLMAQVASNLGLAVALGMLGLGSIAASDLGGLQAGTTMGIDFAVILLLSFMPLGLPISLLLAARQTEIGRRPMSL